MKFFTIHEKQTKILNYKQKIITQTFHVFFNISIRAFELLEARFLNWASFISFDCSTWKLHIQFPIQDIGKQTHGHTYLPALFFNFRPFWLFDLETPNPISYSRIFLCTLQMRSYCVLRSNLVCTIGKGCHYYFAYLILLLESC